MLNDNNNNLNKHQVEVKTPDVSVYNNINSDEKNFDVDSSFYSYNPIIKESTYFDNSLLFYGEFLNDKPLLEDYTFKLLLFNEEDSITIEQDIEVKDNKFYINIHLDNLFFLKESSHKKWIFKLGIYKNDELLNKIDINNNLEESFMIKKEIKTTNDTTTLSLLNKDNILTLNFKSKVSVSHIVDISLYKKKIKVKYRTKDVLKKSFSNKMVTILCLKDKNIKPYKTKVIGKKTYICYYKVSNPKDIVKQMFKDNIFVKIQLGSKYYKTNITELDKYAVFLSFWDRFQNSKEYKKYSLKFYNNIFLKMPIKKKRILFESFLGRNISGNPKYLYNYLVENGLDNDYELIWILNNPNEKPLGEGKTVKRKTFKYYYYMATAGYWIFNSRQADDIVKRDGNIYLQTWHGTPLKRLGADMATANMAGMNDIDKYKEQFKKNSSTWDYLLAQNKYSEEIFKRAFYFDNEILTYGYPANDILYKCNNKVDIDKLKDKFNLPKDKKIILYCPTWRDDKFFKKGHYKMSLELDLDKMQKELGDEYIIILRLHYLITNSLNLSKYKGFAYNFSGAYDIQELYLVSDVQITDYSSTMFDYATLRRPEIFFTYDLEKYRDNLRGFYFDLENEAPGPVVTTTDEVIYWLKNLSKLKEEYKIKEENFYNKFCSLDSENSSQKVIERIFS